MGALDQSPEALGGLIGAALVGTFAGIFLSYALVAPIAQKIKITRRKQMRTFTLIKQTLLAFMNGAMPQVRWSSGARQFPQRSAPRSTWWRMRRPPEAAMARSRRRRDHQRRNA